MKINSKLIIAITSAAIRLSFPCSGLYCKETPDFKITDSKNILKRRVFGTEFYNVVDFPVKDTIRQTTDSKVDSICSSVLKIVHYTSKITLYQANIKTSNSYLILDTIGQSWSCPNNNCVHDYFCTVNNGIK